jgi:hypothetical protein
MAAHFGFNQAGPMVAAPFLPDLLTQPARRSQDFTSCIVTATVRFAGAF